MKKFIIIAIIGLLGIAAMLGSTVEDVPEETEADTKTEETSEVTDKVKKEQKAEEEREAKEKAEAERKQEEKKAKEEEAKQKAEEEQKAKQKAEEEAEAQAKAEEAEKLRKENEATDKANAEEIYLQIMRDSVGSYVDIQFDKTEKTYVMTPIDQNLIDEISMLPMGIGHEEWGVLVDGMTSMSKSGKDLVGEGYTINLVNPLNHENVILWIVDGEVIYNVIDDL